MIIIRNEHSADAIAIESVIVAAFRSAKHSGGTEQWVVRALRESGRLAVSLVAEDGQRIVGHVAASPVIITGGVQGWYGLGPVSVIPERQKQNIGTKLITQALAELRTLGAAGCVVLGEPTYYSRFGFKPDSRLVLPGVPPEYFQFVAFNGDCPTGEVAYDAAFEVTG